jgi:hypothetical protein
MSDRDEVDKLKRRVDELLAAVKLMHEQVSKHAQYQEGCAVCQAIWRAA